MCALNFSTDWSNDQPCKPRKEILLSKVSILRKKDKGQFTVIDTEDINMEAPVFMPIDPNQENDEEIKIV